MNLQLFSHSPDVQAEGYANGKADLVVANDGTYLAYPEFSSPHIHAFKFGRDGVLHKMPTPSSLPTGGRGCGWSPDGTRLAFAGKSGALMVYARSGTTLTWEQDLVVSGASNDAAYSPNGQYLVAASGTTPYIRFFSWDGGTTYTQLADPAALPAGTAKCVAWSRDSTYVAVAHATTPFITIYRNNGDGTFTKIADPASLPAGDGFGCAFSPNRDMLAVTYWSVAPFIHLYDYNTGTNAFTRRDTHLALPDNGYGIKFGSDMLIAGHDVVAAGDALSTYFEWDGSQFGAGRGLGQAATQFNWTPGVELTGDGSNVFLATDTDIDPLKHYGGVGSIHSLSYDQGAQASRPGSGLRGRIYKSTDTTGFAVDDGNFWHPVPIPEAPPVGSLDWTLVGTLGLGSINNDGARITVRQVGTDKVLVLVPNVTNQRTEWYLIAVSFWSTRLLDSGVFDAFAIRDAFPVDANTLVGVNGTYSVYTNTCVAVSVSNSTLTFGSTFSINPTGHSNAVIYGPGGAGKFVQAWGQGTNGGQQYARMWGLTSALAPSAISVAQQYADIHTITGTTDHGLNPNLGLHHFGNGVFMPFGTRLEGANSYIGHGLIMTWDGTNFAFVTGPTNWYTSGNFYYGSGGQRNIHFNSDDGGPAVCSYAVYDNVSGYDHGIHRYNLNATGNGIDNNNLKHAVGLSENDLAAIAYGQVPILMADQRTRAGVNPRAVNMRADTWAVHATHPLPHDTTQYGIGAGTADRFAIAAWGDAGTLRVRTWYI